MSDSGPATLDSPAGFAIDRSVETPLWRQIATYVHDAVISGRLPHGMGCRRSAAWQNGWV